MDEKLEVGRVMVDSNISAKDNIEYYMCKLTEAMCEKHLAFLGFMRKDNFLYLVGYLDMLKDVFKDNFVIERFDFEKYILTTDDDFWMMDYSDITNPKLMLYTKN